MFFVLKNIIISFKTNSVRDTDKDIQEYLVVRREFYSVHENRSYRLKGFTWIPIVISNSKWRHIPDVPDLQAIEQCMSCFPVDVTSWTSICKSYLSEKKTLSHIRGGIPDYLSDQTIQQKALHVFTVKVAERACFYIIMIMFTKFCTQRNHIGTAWLGRNIVNVKFVNLGNVNLWK